MVAVNALTHSMWRRDFCHFRSVISQSIHVANEASKQAYLFLGHRYKYKQKRAISNKGRVLGLTLGIAPIALQSTGISCALHFIPSP